MDEKWSTVHYTVKRMLATIYFGSDSMTAAEERLISGWYTSYWKESFDDACEIDSKKEGKYCLVKNVKHVILMTKQFA